MQAPLCSDTPVSSVDPDWKRYEKLCEKIVAELRPTATVKWNAKVKGTRSGHLRQVDVAAWWVEGDSRMFTAIDCKHWGRPADIPTIEGFAGLCSDVEATQSILICSAGFTDTVHDYARNLGVELMLIHDAESTLWSQNLTVPILWIDHKPQTKIVFEAYFHAGDQVQLLRPAFVRAETPDKDMDLMSIFEEFWNRGDLPMQPGATYEVLLADHALAPCIDASGRRALRPLFRCGFTYTVIETAWLGQFEPKKCRALINVLQNNAATVSHMPVSEIPEERDAAWQPISDPAAIALSIEGTYVTSWGYDIVSAASVDPDSVSVRRIG